MHGPNNGTPNTTVVWQRRPPRSPSGFQRAAPFKAKLRQVGEVGPTAVWLTHGVYSSVTTTIFEPALESREAA